MIANLALPSSVIVLTRNAPSGTSPWSVPPLATFPVGFQLIGQNGLRAEASRLKEDLFLRTIGTGSSVDLFLSAGAASCAGLFFASSVGACGGCFARAGAAAVFSSAAVRNCAAKIDNEMSARNFFIVFRLRWSRQWR